METTPPGDTLPNAPSSPQQLLIMALIIILMFFGIDDLLGWINGGGVFSYIAAMRAAQARVQSIEVDGAALRTFFIVGCTLVVTALAIPLRANLDRRLHALVFCILIMMGGFVLDAVYGPAIIGHAMAGKGYLRCMAGDREVGAGKSRVWFDDYVRAGTHCAAHAG